MIEFSGEISDKVQLKVSHKSDREVGLLMLPVFAIVTIATIILAVLGAKINSYVSYIEPLILDVIILILIVISLISPFPKKYILRKKWVSSVIIDNDNVNYTKSGIKNIIPLTKVKKVLEDEDCYYIIINSFNRSIICEKALLKQGSLSDFEKLFESKLKKPKVQDTENKKPNE